MHNPSEETPPPTPLSIYTCRRRYQSLDSSGVPSPSLAVVVAHSPADALALLTSPPFDPDNFRRGIVTKVGTPTPRFSRGLIIAG